MRGKTADAALGELVVVAPVQNQDRVGHHHAVGHIDEDRIVEEGVIEAHRGITTDLEMPHHLFGPGHIFYAPKGDAQIARDQIEALRAAVVHHHLSRQRPHHGDDRMAQGGGAVGVVDVCGRGEVLDHEVVDGRVAPHLLALRGHRGRDERRVAGHPSFLEPRRPGQGGGILGAKCLQGEPFSDRVGRGQRFLVNERVLSRPTPHSNGPGEVAWRPG